MAKNTPRVYLLNNGKYVSHSFYGNESPSEEANTTITFNTNEIDLGKISRTVMVGYDLATKEPKLISEDYKEAICRYEEKTLEELSKG